MRKSATALALVLCCLLVALYAGGCGDQATSDTGGSLPVTTVAGSDGVAAVDSVHWTRLQPAGKAPSGRFAHTLVYDPGLSKMLLFGGWDDTGSVQFNDTWAYDPAANTWTELNPAGDVPLSRGFHDAAYDPDSGTVLIFGGMRGKLQILDDFWAYDPAANTWTESEAGADARPVRRDPVVVHVPSAGLVILFGGYDGSTVRNDTWAYDPAANTWTELHPTGAAPSARALHAMICDTARGRVMLFGGMDEANQVLNDLWTYDLAANTWTELEPAGAVPSARVGHSMTYDPESGKILLFGGMDETNGNLNDLWVYDPAANTWTELEPAGEVPLARDAHAMAYNPESGKIILFGGEGECGDLDDTWELTF
jgi:N-acetylneuraminic acid mutarotase